MKFCERHIYLLTGDGECYQCEKESLHNLICQLQQDINLGNAVIIKQKQEIADLKEQLQKLQ
jgi:hypothetical protein